MSSVLLQSLFLLAGFSLLILGAQVLIRGSASLALRLGLPPLFIGLTIVAIGTSAPELVVSLSSALRGHGDVSVGNVVGSNIFNIAAILGVTALITPIRVNLSVIKLDIPVMITVSVAAALLFLFSQFSRFTGGLLVTTLICYFFFTFRSAKREDHHNTAEVPVSGVSLPFSLLLIGTGLLLLVTGSELVVSSATSIAIFFKVSEAVIALTIVGMGTSIPELVTSIVAAVKKQPDMAIGNVVGSNIFNILGVLGISSLITPLSAPGVHALVWLVMVGFAVLLLPLAYTDRMLDRREGALFCSGYTAYIWRLLL